MLDTVISRLKSETNGAFRLIEGGLSFAALDGQPAQFPAAYVVPLTDHASANNLITGVRQTVTRRFGVVIATKKANDKGAGRANEIDDLSGQVRAALVGWQPEMAMTPIILSSGGMASTEAGVAWWLDEFSFDFLLNA